MPLEATRLFIHAQLLGILEVSPSTIQDLVLTFLGKSINAQLIQTCTTRISITTIESHPLTYVVIIELQVPQWQDLKQLSYKSTHANNIVLLSKQLLFYSKV